MNVQIKAMKVKYMKSRDTLKAKRSTKEIKELLCQIESIKGIQASMREVDVRSRHMIFENVSVSHILDIDIYVYLNMCVCCLKRI